MKYRTRWCKEWDKSCICPFHLSRAFEFSKRSHTNAPRSRFHPIPMRHLCGRLCPIKSMKRVRLTGAFLGRPATMREKRGRAVWFSSFHGLSRLLQPKWNEKKWMMTTRIAYTSWGRISPIQTNILSEKMLLYNLFLLLSTVVWLFCKLYVPPATSK